MERLTTRHNGVAVIKDKSKHKEAMEKLARYEETREWVLASERLPEVLDNLENKDSFMKSMYLVTDGYGIVVSLFDGVFRDMIDFEKYNDVLAWMPLPEAYRKDVE